MKEWSALIRGKNMYWIALIAVLSLASMPAPAQSGSRSALHGVVEGTVLDHTGRPLGGVQVNIDPYPRPMTGILIFATTNDDGHFRKEGLEFGQYAILAIKRAAGYPNTRASFYNYDEPPIVTLSDARPAAEVTVRLRPPAGAVYGHILDVQTGTPIENASVKMVQAKQPGRMYGTSVPSFFRVLVPPDVDVLLTVSAPGYEPWAYPGPNGPRKSISLKSAQEMELTVRLVPAQSKNSPSPQNGP